MKKRVRRLVLDAFLEAAHSLPAPDSKPAQISPVSDGFVLPPYPGEMGIEIRYFLARVEPWLRAGWKILSRRPELYPEGSAILDDALTEAENALFARYGAVRLATGPKIVHVGERLPDRMAAMVARAKARRLQEEWRRLLSPYFRTDGGRPWTLWDRALTTVLTDFSPHEMWAYGSVLPPTNLPPAFVSESSDWTYPDHVGVQLRAVTWNPDGRNSDVGAVMADAQAVAKHLSLPVLVYGEPEGCTLPDGTRTTASLGNGRLLSRELGYLRTCRVMMAPNSGWADLMCWLRVPVLIERTEPLSVLDMMAAFGPRMLVRQSELPAEAQVDALLRGETAFPMLGFSTVSQASLDDWVVDGQMALSPWQ